MKKGQKQGFTLVELMVSVSVLGVLSTVGVSAFGNYSKRAKTAEAALSIDRIYEGAVTYFNSEHTARGSVKSVTYALPPGFDGWTPTGKPKAGRGNRYTHAEWMKIQRKNNVKGRTWRALDFTMSQDFYYKYKFYNPACPGTSCANAVGGQVLIEAAGDLDGDAEFSSFSRTVEIVRTDDGSLILAGQPVIVAENPLE